MVDATQFPFQLTPVDYDPFSEAYAYSQKLAKQQQDNALMAHAVGMPAQGPTAAEMSRDPSAPLGVRAAARVVESTFGLPKALMESIDNYNRAATGESYLQPGLGPLSKEEAENAAIMTGFNMSLGGAFGPRVPGKLKMGYSGHDAIPELTEKSGGPIPHEAISPALYKMYKWHEGDYSQPASNPSLQIPADKPQMVDYLAGKISHNDFMLHPETTLEDAKHPMIAAKASFEANPNLHLEKVNPDVMLENHPMKGAINDFAADPFEQTKVMPNSETEKQLHGFLEDYSLSKENGPKLGDKEVAIPYNKQNLHDYLSGKISYNEFSNKATQAEFEHPYVNPKLYNEMQLDLPANKAYTPADIIAAKKLKTAAKEPSLHSDEFWNKDWEPDWEPGVRPEPAGQAPNWTYTNPESLANRYSRPATEPPASKGKDPYSVDYSTEEEYGPEKYEPHLRPVNWSEVKGKSPQNLLTPDMPTYGPAMEQGYNPNLLLHRGTPKPITGQAWWDPSTKPRERGLFAADEPRVAKVYGQNQYPAVGAFDKPMEIDWPTATGRDAYSSAHMPGIIDAARAKGADLLIIRNIEDIVNSGKAAHDQYVVLDPGKLRDPQLAKFDPARKGENNLLAGVAGGMVGLPVMKSLLAPTDEGKTNE